MQIRTLIDTPLETLRQTFELAFSDYELPLQLTIEALRTMIICRDLKLECSLGCFDEEILVGFLLCGIREDSGKKLLYNGSTGVIPSYRGRGIATDMLHAVLDWGHAHAIHSVQLEVLEHNRVAQHLYRQCGFFNRRLLRCFRTDRPIEMYESVEPGINIRHLSLSTYQSLPHTQLVSYPPSWQNAVPSVCHGWADHEAVACWIDEKLIGYGVVHAHQGAIAQIAAPDDRTYGVLMRALGRLTEIRQLRLVNVEDESDLCHYLICAGWENYLNQYEMYYDFDR